MFGKVCGLSSVYLCVCVSVCVSEREKEDCVEEKNAPQAWLEMNRYITKHSIYTCLTQCQSLINPSLTIYTINDSG